MKHPTQRSRCRATWKGEVTGTKYRCPKLATVVRMGTPYCDAHDPRARRIRGTAKGRGLTVRQSAEFAKSKDETARADSR